MSDPKTNRKGDGFRAAPRQEKIKPVAASRDVPGEMSSAFGRGNVVAKIVRFPPADLEKADRFRSAPRKLGIPMKVIGVPGDRDRDSGIEPISGRSEATLAVGFCRK